MSEQKMGKNKIGARCLSDSEIELILPAYLRIYDQIEQFRREKQSMSRSEMQTAENQNKDQKTNNIGIIGTRGAGKTSVLKTIQIQLEKKKHKKKLNDIILPLIIPENMSESGTLMATILGMLSDIVRERADKEKKEKKASQEDSDYCIRENSLLKKCNEVIKQYTYIQKEYRDILIQQYTTENDYVRSSATVFNSDTEFINKFNELIDELIGVEKQDGSLLFIFIDDIDLSTYRCADVVKTLLSYLSNENIVTFISGDFNTFEEALTLDFLRQENVLDKDILEKEIGRETLLASKKHLAYEYLKKIIPPAYRYNIKNWPLEEKREYCVEAAVEDQDNSEKNTEQSAATEQSAGVTLADLLSQALEGWVDPAFFGYAKIANGDEGDNQIQNSDKERKHRSKWDAMPYTYHLFDITSRGLNNIYNVLSEIAARRKADKKEEDYYKEKKLLLDTIVSSKPIYNNYRDVIQQNFFHIAKEDSKVYFDNAKAVIYKENFKENQNEYYIEDPVDRFSLFILVDFAARLLYESDYEEKIKEDGFYKLLKEEAMKDLFFHPIIAEKVMDTTRHSWETKEETDKREAAQRTEKVYPELKDMNLKHINSSFLMKGDLVLNLAYYKNISLDGILRLYEDTESSKSGNKELLVTAELEQNTIIAIWKAFSSVAKVKGIKEISDLIAKYYAVFWMEFAYIRNKLSSSVTQNIVIRLFERDINAVVKDKNQEDYRKIAQMRRILSNTIAQALAEQDKDAIKEEWQEIDFKNLYIVETETTEKNIDSESAEKESIEERAVVLKAMDSAGLWKAEAVETAVSYLKQEIRKYLRFIRNRIQEGTAEDWIINTKDAGEAWHVFENTYVGETNTIARRTRSSVKQILYNYNTNFSQGMTYKVYSDVIIKLEELAGNSRVWYGQSEAQQIINDMQKAFAEPVMQDKKYVNCSDRYPYFVFLLQCMYKYRKALMQKDSTMQEAVLLADITKILSISHKEADRRTLEEFIRQLNGELENEIDSEGFEKLFSDKL